MFKRWASQRSFEYGFGHLHNALPQKFEDAEVDLLVVGVFLPIEAHEEVLNIDNQAEQLVHLLLGGVREV